MMSHEFCIPVIQVRRKYMFRKEQLKAVKTEGDEHDYY
jgi:hypothetical protein